MFNDFKGYDENGNPVAISIPPTLLISAISVMPDLFKTVSPEFKNDRDVIYLLGETNDELGGGEYFKMIGTISNNMPKVNLEKNLKVYLALEEVIQKELIASSLSVTSGGLGIALAKACVGGMLGCNVSLSQIAPKALSGDAKLFSESQGRILVSVASKNIKEFEKIMKKVTCVRLGQVTKDEKVIIIDGKNKIVKTNVKKLHKIYHSFSNSQK
jgi:phosphoribosylformylglycinamidine synthase